MTKQDFNREVIRAIEKINRKIDMLIIEHKDYAKLAKEHLRLRSLLTE